MSDFSQETWSKILNSIKADLNPQSYEAWFTPIRLSSISDAFICIEVPDEFFKSWLVDHYSDTIRRSVSLATGKDLKIEFLVQKPGDKKTDKPGPHPQLPPQSQTQIRHPSYPEFESLQGVKTFDFDPKYTFDTFVVGPCNRFAHAASLAVCESPAKAYNPLFIYGGVGLGKTHLMKSVANKILTGPQKLKVVYISSEKFTNQLISSIQNRTTIKFRQLYRTVDVLLIDDIHFIAGKESTQEGFFHTFNALHEANKQIVISSDRPPKEIPGLEERLVSRFEWGLVVDMQPPDLETRIAILKKKAEREGIDVPDDAMFSIGEKVRSNIRELEGALIRVVAYSKLMNESINLGLVENVLKDMFVEESKKITIDLIQKSVADYFDLRISDLRSKKRSQDIAYPRQVAMFLVRDMMGCSLTEIGEYFGGRDHTTVLHSCEKMTKLIKKDAKTKGIMGDLVEIIKK